MKLIMLREILRPGIQPVEILQAEVFRMEVLQLGISQTKTICQEI